MYEKYSCKEMLKNKQTTTEQSIEGK